MINDNIFSTIFGHGKIQFSFFFFIYDGSAQRGENYSLLTLTKFSRNRHIFLDENKKEGGRSYFF